MIRVDPVQENRHVDVNILTINQTHLSNLNPITKLMAMFKVKIWKRLKMNHKDITTFYKYRMFRSKTVEGFKGFTLSVRL